MIERRIIARRIIISSIAYCALTLTGCSAWLANGQGLSEELSKGSRGATAADMPNKANEDGNAFGSDSGDSSTNRDPSARSDQHFAELGVAEWVLAAADASDVDRLLNPFAEPRWPARRWRHEGVEAILSRADAARQLKIAARSRDQTAAINAAIGLARLGDAAVISNLADAALSDKRPRSMRGAAIESLAFLEATEAEASLARLANEMGQWQGNSRSRYNPDLHADVIRAIGVRGSWRSAPAIAAALGSPSAEVRYEAARASERLEATAELTPRIVDLVGDDSAKVRAAAVRTLVACRNSAAQGAVERALSDEDLGVRIAAVHSLPELGGAANHDRLLRLMDDLSESIRAAAVHGLVRSNDVGSAAQGAADKSWRVRLALAASLKEMPPQYGSPLAMQLMVDADLKVQRRAVESIATWPTVNAIPLLLSAAARGSLLTRRDAIQQLQHRWSAAEGFPEYASADRQLEEIQRLKRVWEAEITRTTTATVEPASRQITADDEARAVSAITALAVGSPADRRAAARRLAAEYQEKPIPPAAVEKLAELMEAETDGLIWIDVLSVVARSETQAAARLAAAASSHANPEVRRRACAWFAMHPSDRGADVLVNSLADNDASVVRAAVNSLGVQRQVTDLRPLEGLLSADDHTLRVAAAESLARLRSPAGFQALSRLTYDHEARVCGLAATAIGNTYGVHSTNDQVIPAPESADSMALADEYRSQFVTDLARLLDGRAEVRRAAVIALAKVTGEEPPKTAVATPSRAFGTLPHEDTDTAAVAWWKKRFATNQDSAH